MGKAESARYESALLIPWASLTDAVVKAVGGDSGLLMDLHVPEVQVSAQDIPVDLSDIQIQVNGRIASAPSQNGEVHWSGDPLGVHIRVGAFEVSQVVQRWVSGVQVRVHLQALCHPFELIQNSAAMNVGLSWQSEGTALSAQVAQMELSWPQESWQVGEIVCEGPKGFADVIQAELSRQLSDPTQWISLIKSELQSQLNQKIAETLEGFKEPRTVYSDEQTRVALHFSGVEALSEKGLVLKGFVDPQKTLAAGGSDGADTGDGMVSTQDFIPLDVNAALAKVTTDTPLLLIPGKELARVTRELASERELDFNLTQISSFKSFLKNWFLQFFFWPDLLNYSSSSQFPVISKMQKDPEVVYSASKLYFKGQAWSWVYSNRGGKVNRYIDSSTAFSSWVTPVISSGRLQLTFDQRKIDTSTKMASDYVSFFHPRTFLATWILKEALEKLPVFDGLSLSLPEVEVNGGVKYRAYKMHTFVKDLFIIELRKN